MKRKPKAAADPKPKQYLVTVVVEHLYEKVIQATSLAAAETLAAEESIQSDEANYVGSDTMEPTVEPHEED